MSYPLNSLNGEIKLTQLNLHDEPRTLILDPITGLPVEYDLNDHPGEDGQTVSQSSEIQAANFPSLFLFFSVNRKPYQMINLSSTEGTFLGLLLGFRLGRGILGLSQGLSSERRFDLLMFLPKARDNVKVTLMSGEIIEGSIAWIDGDGALIKMGSEEQMGPPQSLPATTANRRLERS